MIEAFQNINKAFESKVRLGIMAVLMVNEEADFNFLKEQLSLTDGNLASHTRALEELGYIECSKGLSLIHILLYQTIRSVPPLPSIPSCQV